MPGEVESMAALVEAAGIVRLKGSSHYFPDDRRGDSWLWVTESFNLRNFS